MNIGIVVDNELNNDKRILREIEVLKEAGHGISVLCFGLKHRLYSRISGIDITRIFISQRLKDLLFFFLNTLPVYEWLWSRRIASFIIRGKIEALHVHDLYMSKAGYRGIRKSGRKIPMILDLHENYPYAVTTYNWTKGFLRNLLSRPSLWAKKEKEYLQYADKIIVLSDDFRDMLTKRYSGLSSDKFAIFPNVPDLKHPIVRRPVTPQVNIGRDKKVLFYFGVVAERRGIFDVIEVIRELAGENHPSSFLIVGPVDKKDRKRFAEILNSEILKDRIFYIPWIDQEELDAFLEMSDICIAPFHKNPQHESGVANKIFDYMLGKKPIVASDCAPQKKLIEKFNCGIIFSDNQEMKSAIIMLSADETLCKKMGENGFNAIISGLNISAFRENLLRIYNP